MPKSHHAIYEPYDGVAALTRILRSRCSPQRKIALLYVLQGLSYRKAERASGGHDDVCLFKNARRLGLQEIHDQRKRERDALACPAKMGPASTRWSSPS